MVLEMGIGPIVNGSAIVLGGVSGAFLGDWVPERVRSRLPLVFGCTALCLGICLLIRVKSLPPVVLALISGTIIGELIYLEKGLHAFARGARKLMERLTQNRDGDASHEIFMEKFIAILVLFCCSSMGIFGALTEGMTGDPTLLLAKSVLDLFTAAVFAVSLGYSVATLAVPQFFIQMGLLLSATIILPLTTPTMLADFTACGGMILVATGLTIAGIKSFPIAAMLPSLAIVMPLSALWLRFSPLN